MLDKSPEGFPPNTLTIMRALCVLTVVKPGKEGQDLLIKVLDVLFPSYWVEGKRTFEKDVLNSILRQVLGEKLAGDGTFSPGEIERIWYFGLNCDGSNGDDTQGRKRDFVEEQ